MVEAVAAPAISIATGTTTGEVSAEGALPTIETLRSFTPTKILSSSTLSGSIYVLGTLILPSTTTTMEQPAIIHIQRTAIGPTLDVVRDLVGRGLGRWEVFLENQPYFSAHAWTDSNQATIADYQIKIICPATETHIKKYTAQSRALFLETKEIYDNVVIDYINSFPPERLGWVYAILDGEKEADRVLYRLSHPKDGFVILPDLKWDQTSMNALYLTVLVETREIKTLRDLSHSHLPLLRDIRQTVFKVVRERFHVDASQLRLFVHYQPSYYHFHVHVTHIAHEPSAGMLVGQAHMLDDIISLLELLPAHGPSILAQKTYTYPLGEEHKLYAKLVQAGALIRGPEEEEEVARPSKVAKVDDAA